MMKWRDDEQHDDMESMHDPVLWARSWTWTGEFQLVDGHWVNASQDNLQATSTQNSVAPSPYIPAIKAVAL
jgi:hypothetical protein